MIHVRPLRLILVIGLVALSLWSWSASAQEPVDLVPADSPSHGFDEIGNGVKRQIYGDEEPSLAVTVDLSGTKGGSASLLKNPDIQPNGKPVKGTGSVCVETKKRITQTCRNVETLFLVCRGKTCTARITQIVP